jgi:hypothetical protein
MLDLLALASHVFHSAAGIEVSDTFPPEEPDGSACDLELARITFDRFYKSFCAKYGYTSPCLGSLYTRLLVSLPTDVVSLPTGV